MEEAISSVLKPGSCVRGYLDREVPGSGHDWTI
jgi:hypothetical protein